MGAYPNILQSSLFPPFCLGNTEIIRIEIRTLEEKHAVGNCLGRFVAEQMIAGRDSWVEVGVFAPFASGKTELVKAAASSAVGIPIAFPDDREKMFGFHFYDPLISPIQVIISDIKGRNIFPNPPDLPRLSERGIHFVENPDFFPDTDNDPRFCGGYKGTIDIGWHLVFDRKSGFSHLGIEICNPVISRPDLLASLKKSVPTILFT